MAPSKTAQPKHSLRKIAVVVATAVSGMSVYAQAAVEPKEDTITVTAAPAPQESAWGRLQLLRRDSQLPALKPIRRFKKYLNLFLSSPLKRWRCISLSR